MDQVTITRFADTPFGVFGRLSLKDGATLYTVERPWLNNAPQISCIPLGNYRCEPKRYRRGGYDAIKVTKVAGRSHILFHRGNRVTDTKGCILLASSLGCLSGEWSGLSSKRAFSAFMQDYGNGFDLTIEYINHGEIV